MAPNGFTDHGTIWVCACCMLVHANGECADDCHSAEPWSQLPTADGWDAAMGTGEHSEYCTPEDREEGCDCDHTSFSWSACDGCGSSLGGDRYAFTLRRVATPASAL
jgi:hypothetical protein